MHPVFNFRLHPAAVQVVPTSSDHHHHHQSMSGRPYCNRLLQSGKRLWLTDCTQGRRKNERDGGHQRGHVGWVNLERAATHEAISSLSVVAM
jgi:hypothetical protein